jgi:Protein of unknown function (DUF3224)
MRRGVSSPLLIVCLWLALLGSSFLFNYFPGHVTYAKETDAPKREWIACKNITDSRQDGDNQMITATVTEKFSGMLNGTCEAAERETVRKDGAQSFSGSGTFSGQVNGRSGTAIFTYSGALDANGKMTANWVLDKGTDDLARIDGQGTFEGKRTHPAPNECGDSESESAWNGTYSGTVQF